MLAAATDYFFQTWEIPIWICVIFVSLMLGGYFLSTGIQKTGVVKKMSLGMGILGMFIIGAISAGIAGTVYMAGVRLSANPFTIIGILGGAVTFVIMFYLMVWTWQKKLSTNEIIKICILPLLTIAAQAVIIVTPTIVIAYNIRQGSIQEEKLKGMTQQNLFEIYKALRERGVDRPPASLEVLVQEKLISADRIKSPANPNRAIGFVYVPVELSYSNREENGNMIVACDYADNFGKDRVVLFATGKIQTLSEASFQDSLQLPENKQIKQALQKLENPQKGK